jgi:hypothetical protein
MVVSSLLHVAQESSDAHFLDLHLGILRAGNKQLFG